VHFRECGECLSSGLIRDVLVREEPLMLRPGQFYVISSALGVTGFALLVCFFRVLPCVCHHSDCDHVRVRLLAIFFDWRDQIGRASAALQLT
jgi:uncharacterized membrane protein YeiH